MTTTISGLNGVSKVAVGVVGTAELANQAVTPDKESRPLTRLASVDTVGSPEVTISGIPSWGQVITVGLQEVSSAGTSNVGLRLGTAGATVSSGYLGSAGIVSAGGSSNDTTMVFFALSGTAANKSNGVIVLTHMGNDLWAIQAVCGRSTSNFVDIAGYTVQLPGPLEKLVFRTGNGTDALDGGKVCAVVQG